MSYTYLVHQSNLISQKKLIRCVPHKLTYLSEEYLYSLVQLNKEKFEANQIIKMFDYRCNLYNTVSLGLQWF